MPSRSPSRPAGPAPHGAGTVHRPRAQNAPREQRERDDHRGVGQPGVRDEHHEQGQRGQRVQHPGGGEHRGYSHFQRLQAMPSGSDLTRPSSAGTSPGGALPAESGSYPSPWLGGLLRGGALRRCRGRGLLAAGATPSRAAVPWAPLCGRQRAPRDRGLDRHPQPLVGRLADPRPSSSTPTAWPGGTAGRVQRGPASRCARRTCGRTAPAGPARPATRRAFPRGHRPSPAARLVPGTGDQDPVFPGLAGGVGRHGRGRVLADHGPVVQAERPEAARKDKQADAAVETEEVLHIPVEQAHAAAARGCPAGRSSRPAGRWRPDPPPT